MYSNGETAITEDMVKYPFSKKAVEYIEKHHITIDDLESTKIALDRAEERINYAIKYATIRNRNYANLQDKLELVSFPIAVFFVSSINNSYITKRYALAEAKLSYEYLKKEDINIIRLIANDFSWQIVDLKNQQSPFGVYFTNYLSNSIRIKEARWRLVNRRLKNGYIYLKKLEMARLLQEEIRRKIENNIRKGEAAIPKALKPFLDNLKRNYSKMMPIKSSLSIKASKESFKSYPPCIKALYHDLISEKNLSHIGRFTLTSFFLNIGWSVEDIIKIFTKSTDYDNTKTRYQIKHISGTSRGREKYSPPKCSTLKTHGLCRNSNNHCLTINHPLQYNNVNRNEGHH